MNGPILTEGEANDFRARMREFDRRVGKTEVDISVHEQKCASRFLMIMLGIAISIGINLPAAWPHLMTILGVVR